VYTEIIAYLKVKSLLMIFSRYTDLKYKYGNGYFWYRENYVDTIGKNAKKVVDTTGVNYERT